MTTVDQFLEALGAVESSNNPQAWGDDGRAMGRWQVHPDRVWSESRLCRVAPVLGESWNGWIGRILAVIFKGLYPVESPVAIAMYWHLGHFSKPGATIGMLSTRRKSTRRSKPRARMVPDDGSDQEPDVSNRARLRRLMRRPSRTSWPATTCCRILISTCSTARKKSRCSSCGSRRCHSGTW